MSESAALSAADDAGVRAAESAYDAAWNAGDLEALLDCFADDAVLVNPFGEVAAGIEEIRERLGAFLGGTARGSKHTSTLLRVAFVTPDVAVVDGEARVERSGTASESWSLTHRFTDVLVRRHRRWRIAHVRAYGPTGAGPPPSGSSEAGNADTARSSDARVR